MAKKKAAISTSPSDLNRVITAVEKVQALSDAFLGVKRARFRLDQSGAKLKDAERLALEADYDAARDAYYKGLSSFVDAAEPSVALLLEDLLAQTKALKDLQVSQATAGRVIDAIAGVVGLAGKLLVLGVL